MKTSTKCQVKISLKRNKRNRPSMPALISIEMGEICRVCLTQAEKSISIFAETMFEEEAVDFRTMLARCASIEINSEDNLPKNICFKCMTNVIAFYEFRALCQRSNTLLVDHFLGTKDEIVIDKSCIDSYADEVMFTDEVQMEEKPPYLEPQIIDHSETGDELKDLIKPYLLYEEKGQAPELVDQTLDTNAQLDALPESLQKTKTDLPYNLVIKCIKNEPATPQKEGTKENHQAIVVKKEELDDPEFKFKQITNRENLTLDLDLVTINRVKQNGKTKKKYTCKICNKILYTYYGAKVHLRIHTGVRQHKCPQEGCKWSFYLRSSLQKHMLRHINNPTHLCSICGKAYITSDSLQKHHMTVHDDSRPFQCMFCDRNYKMSGHLKKHMLVNHTEDRPFICEVCGRGYTSKYVMERHYKKYCSRGVIPGKRFYKPKGVIVEKLLTIIDKDKFDE